MTTDGQQRSDPVGTVFRVPRVLLHAYLWNFEWPSVSPQRLRETVLDFLERLKLGKAPHLLLTGKPGCGKSHLGVALYREVANWVGTQEATWLNVPAFCEDVKRGYNGQGADPWALIEDASRLLVLDDLFGRELSTHESGQILYRIIDTAYCAGAAIVANMNQDINELPTRLASHEISRLLSDSTIVPMVAQRDWRRR